jgi:hypothetical protein
MLVPVAGADTVASCLRVVQVKVAVPALSVHWPSRTSASWV